MLVVVLKENKSSRISHNDFGLEFVYIDKKISFVDEYQITYEENNEVHHVIFDYLIISNIDLVNFPLANNIKIICEQQNNHFIPVTNFYLQTSLEHIYYGDINLSVEHIISGDF